MISDIVLSKELPDDIKKSIAAYTGCISGAVLKEHYIEMIKEAGFKDVKVMSEFNISIPTISGPLISVTVKGIKSQS